VTLVLDSSAVVAALLDRGADGQWARGLLGSAALAAPAHLFVEASDIIRRAVLAGRVGREVASIAHEDLVLLPVQVFAFEPLAGRVWALSANVPAYDAAYVALAEALEAPLATLDRRLASATGPACEFLLPD